MKIFLLVATMGILAIIGTTPAIAKSKLLKPTAAMAYSQHGSVTHKLPAAISAFQLAPTDTHRLIFRRSIFIFFQKNDEYQHALPYNNATVRLTSNAICISKAMRFIASNNRN